MANIMRLGGGGGGKPKKLLSSLTEGSLVSVLEDGKLVPFYVAKHDYEADLNGEGRTLLVRKDVHSNRVWDADGGKNYGASDLDVWFNGDYKDSLSNIVKGHIGVTEFPCAVGNGNTTLTAFSRSVFLLSFAELNFTNSGGTTEGTALPIANVLKVAYLNGVASNYWLRSPHVNMGAFYMTVDGSLGAQATTTSCGVRPCFTLPADMALNTEPYGDGSWGLADEADVVPETYFPQLLWTNANPTSSFPAQTLTLATGYSGYVVEVKGSIWGDTYGYGLLFCDGSVTYPCIGVRTAETGAGNSYARWINSVSYGSISFGLANGSYSDAAIPTRIWGVNLSM